MSTREGLADHSRSPAGRESSAHRITSSSHPDTESIIVEAKSDHACTSVAFIDGSEVASAETFPMNIADSTPERPLSDLREIDSQRACAFQAVLRLDPFFEHCLNWQSTESPAPAEAAEQAAFIPASQASGKSNLFNPDVLGEIPPGNPSALQKRGSSRTPIVFLNSVLILGLGVVVYADGAFLDARERLMSRFARTKREAPIGQTHNLEQSKASVPMDTNVEQPITDAPNSTDSGTVRIAQVSRPSPLSRAEPAAVQEPAIVLSYDHRRIRTGDTVTMHDNTPVTIEVSYGGLKLDEALEIEVVKEFTPVIPAQQLKKGGGSDPFRFGVHLDHAGLYAVRLLKNRIPINSVTFEMMRP